MCNSKRSFQNELVNAITKTVIILSVLCLVAMLFLIGVQCSVLTIDCLCDYLSSPTILRYIVVALFSLVTLWVAIVTLRSSIHTSEIEAIVSLRNLFYQEGNLRVHRKILNGDKFYLTDDQKAQVSDNDSKEVNKEKIEDESDVNNYIGTLEVAYLMVERDVINMEEFENLFGYRLNNLYENEELHKYICNDRIYNAILFRAIDALHKYQRERKQKY